MRNMMTILAAADMKMEGLIMVTIYTTDMQEFSALNKVCDSYLEGVSAYPPGCYWHLCAW